jgi:hypothetical protein
MAVYAYIYGGPEILSAVWTEKCPEWGCWGWCIFPCLVLPLCEQQAILLTHDGAIDDYDLRVSSIKVRESCASISLTRPGLSDILNIR